MAGHNWILRLSLVLLTMGSISFHPVLSQISWTPIIYPFEQAKDRVDLWTVSSTGCECPDGKSSKCACCVKPGGCLCPLNHNRCAQCGLEDSSCYGSCNITISARKVASASGLSWVFLKSPELEGPTSCFWRLQSAPGQRIEVQIHRLISVGSFDNSTQSCKDGFLQFADGDTSIPSTQAVQLCGQNSRFSPPVVLFGDIGEATLYLRIEGKSSRSQVLAYVNFVSNDDLSVGIPSRGGRLRPHSVCDWTYDNCWNSECILSSPGFPGLFSPHRRCRYFILSNTTTDKIHITFHSLNIPPPPLCSSHHIAIWKKNVSNLAHLGPPWKTLCQQSDPHVEIQCTKHQACEAMIEFRSGSTTSPNLYNGFLASVEFFHPSSPTTLSPKRTVVAGSPVPAISLSGPNPGKKSSGSARSKGNAEEKERPHSETPLGHSGHQTDDLRPMKLPSVTCGQVFDGGTVREEGFRLKIPKDLGSHGRKNSKGGAGESLNANWNARKTAGTFQCRLEFHGKASDVVQLTLSNYKLRGSNCSSVIELYEIVEEGDRLSNKLCGPSGNEVRRFTSKNYRVAITVVIQTSNNPSGSEFLEGAFRFHDESIEGTVKPESSCEVAFSGTSSPGIGKVVITGPFTSPLLRLSHPFPLDCSYAFDPAPSEGVLLTLLNSTDNGNETLPSGRNRSIISPNNDERQCRTICSTSGCYCDSQLPIQEIDHFTIVAGLAEIGCFCGSLSAVLPVTFESNNPLSLNVHYTNNKVLLKVQMEYQFTPNKARYTNFSIFPPSGWKRWREIIPASSTSGSQKGPNSYVVYDLTWPASIPIRSRLGIDLLSEEDEQDCKAWNFTVWAEHEKFLNRSYLLSLFCPSEGRKEIKVPEPVRSVYIKLQGVSIRVPQFEVRWKYQDSSIVANRLSEKMMSDSASKSSSVLKLEFTGMSFLFKAFLCRILSFSYI